METKKLLNISMAEYSEKAYSLAIYPRTPEYPVSNLVYPVLGLNGEAGEVAEKVKKLIRGRVTQIDNETALAIMKELGDSLWYINACACELGFTLEDVASMNLDKLFDRKDRDVLHGEGDNR